MLRVTSFASECWDFAWPARTAIGGHACALELFLESTENATRNGVASIRTFSSMSVEIEEESAIRSTDNGDFAHTQTRTRGTAREILPGRNLWRGAPLPTLQVYSSGTRSSHAIAGFTHKSR